MSILRLLGVMWVGLGLCGGDGLSWARELVLNQVLQNASALKNQGIQSVVIMDLDETTVDSMPRRLAALQSVSKTACGDPLALHARECERLASVSLPNLYTQKNRYSFTELLEAAGGPASPWSAELERAMVSEYLSGQHIELDRAVAGADVYIEDLHALGAKIIYVSSRFEDVQGAPTRQSLASLGFLNPITLSEVFLRSRGQTSIEFKEKTYDAIAEELRVSPQKQAVLAVFENEPENMVALASHFSDAARVYILGAMIKAGALPEGTAEIVDYQEPCALPGSALQNRQRLKVLGLWEKVVTCQGFNSPSRGLKHFEVARKA